MTIVYTAGPVDPPGWLTSLALRAVRRQMGDNPGGDLSAESLGAYSVTYAGQAGSVATLGILSGDERTALVARYRRTLNTIVPTR